MPPPQYHLLRGLQRAWHGSPGTAAAPHHWAPPKFPSRLGSGGVPHHKAASHSTWSSARHAHSSSTRKPLERSFLALLRGFVDPVLRGALQVLRNTRPTAHNVLTPQFQQAARTAFARAGVRPTVRAGARPFTHTFEPGLQTARKFSTSGVQTAQQVALGIRISVDEARDRIADAKKSARRSGGSSSSSKAFSSKRAQRKGTRPSIAVRAPVQLEQLDLYFPEPSKAHAVRTDEVAAEIIVPLDPDLTNIWDLATATSGAASSSSSGGPLYAGNLGSATLQTSSAYAEHLQKTRELNAILQDLCACILPHTTELAHAPHAMHGIGYKVVVPGYTAAQLREILIDRLGVQQGLWFSTLLRDVRPPRPPQQDVAPRSSPRTSHDGDDGILFSPPLSDEWDTSSLTSSWDGVLEEPPPDAFDELPELSFSSTFVHALDESEYHTTLRSGKVSQYGLYGLENPNLSRDDHSDYDSDDYLQDSRMW